MSQFTLVSFIDTFIFPLHEATRKQLWWEALQQQHMGYSVEILIVNGGNNHFENNGIIISYVSLKQLIRIKTDILHCLTGSISQGIMFLALAKANYRILTLTDGAMFGPNKHFFRKCILKICLIYFDECRVYSKYQKYLLNSKKIMIVKPHLPIIKIPEGVCKNNFPSVLYMGHLSKEKGFDIIIPAMKRILHDYPNLIFTIANNDIKKDIYYFNEVKLLAKAYPEQVIIKGIIDPIVELVKAWVYIYPFISAMGTMAFALSLYESQQCGTPFVTCRVSANTEFFDDKYMIEPNNAEQLYEKVKFFIDEREYQENLQA